MQRIEIKRARARTRDCFLPLLTAVVLAIGLSHATTALAGLHGTTYTAKLTGQVVNSATTPTLFSTEGYEVTTTFDIFSADMPNTIVPTPDPPFDPGDTLQVLESEAAKHVVIWIRGENGMPHTFQNILNPSELVEFEAILYWDDLEPLTKIVPKNFEIENAAEGFYDPVSSNYFGIGSQASPLHIVLHLDPNDVVAPASSHVKVLFEYMEMAVPEPATIGLLLIGIVGLAGGTARRRR